MATTAKVRCSNSNAVGDDQTTYTFGANYMDSEGNRVNEDWAKYTPGFSLSMTVLNSVKFEVGKNYTLTFEED